MVFSLICGAIFGIMGNFSFIHERLRWFADYRGPLTSVVIFIGWLAARLNQDVDASFPFSYFTVSSFRPCAIFACISVSTTQRPSLDTMPVLLREPDNALLSSQWRHGHLLIRGFAFQWWLFRVFMLIYRKLGSANIYTVNQPRGKADSRSRQAFPVNIDDMDSLIDTFQDVRGFVQDDTLEAYRCHVSGYGFIPHDLRHCHCCTKRCSNWCSANFCRKSKAGECSCLRVADLLHGFHGIHIIRLARKHFELEIYGGGGSQSAAQVVKGWRSRVTRISHITGFVDDIKWVKWSKNEHTMASLIMVVLRTSVLIFVISLPIALVLSYPCSDVLNLRGSESRPSFADGSRWSNWTSYL
jgi:hypothetical protein